MSFIHSAGTCARLCFDHIVSVWLHRSPSGLGYAQMAMAKDSPSLRSAAMLVMGLTALLLAGCVWGPGTYPDYNGPRNGDGFLVDPLTGLELPGQADPGK
jgi:hypothetical protein